MSRLHVLDKLVIRITYKLAFCCALDCDCDPLPVALHVPPLNAHVHLLLQGLRHFLCEHLDRLGRGGAVLTQDEGQYQYAHQVVQARVLWPVEGQYSP